MKKVFFLIATGILFLGSACREEHVSPVNQLVKDLFCFKEGSEWTYYDSVSQTTQKMIITNYEARKLASMPEGGRKAYDFAEYIKIEGTFLTNFNMRIQAQGEEIDYENTASFRGTYESIYGHSSLPLHFTCDQNNKFNCSVAYFDKYNMNGISYENMYVFDMDELLYSNKSILFYVAKHIGLIRMTKINEFDWVLTDKNIQQ